MNNIIKKLILKSKNLITFRKNKRLVDLDKCFQELEKADKYYISFRILNRWGFYFQGLNCLLFSLETFFKLIYLLNRETYTNDELRAFGHNLNRIFKKIDLDKKDFSLTFKIVKCYNYTKLRYSNPDLPNELNLFLNKKYPHLDKLNLEIENIHRIITFKIRNKFNIPNYVDGLKIYKYHSLDDEEKKNLIDDAFSCGYNRSSISRS